MFLAPCRPDALARGCHAETQTISIFWDEPNLIDISSHSVLDQPMGTAFSRFVQPYCCRIRTVSGMFPLRFPKQLSKHIDSEFVAYERRQECKKQRFKYVKYI